MMRLGACVVMATMFAMGPGANAMPCAEGGDDCSDYNFLGPCTVYMCSREENRCLPENAPDGTVCGDDYGFPQCIEGPGTCVEGFCQGTVNTDAVCDDFNDCTTNNRCVMVREGDAACRGDAAPGIPCDDYNPDTENDVCQDTDEEYAFCEGTPVQGASDRGYY